MEILKTPSPEEVPIPLLLIVIIMNFIITSSSSDLCADRLYQELLYQDICYSQQGTYPLLIIMSYSIMISSSGVQ